MVMEKNYHIAKERKHEDELRNEAKHNARPIAEMNMIRQTQKQTNRHLMERIYEIWESSSS